MIAGKKSASEVLTEREAKKLLKQKRQAAEILWNARIQATQNWTGDSNTELNQHVSLPELEKAFLESNPHYALDFNLAMKCTSEQSFKIVWDKIVEADVALKVLENRVRAMQTYAGDIHQWQRPDWSPDTNWILPLIAAKKAKSEETEKLPLQKGIEEMKQESESPESERSLNERMDRLRSDLCNNHWLHHYSWEGLDILPFIEAYGIGTGVIDVMQKEIAAAHPKPEVEPDPAEDTSEDTSLDDLNLPAMESFLESLLYHVGQVKHPTDRDNFSCAVFDALFSEGEYVTEREQLSTLLNCAHSIVTEYEKGGDKNDGESECKGADPSVA